MLQADPALAAALRSSAQVGGVHGMALYQGAQTIVPLDTVGEVTFRSEGAIQASGRASAMGDGDSLIPRSKTDPLAPFGQELSLWRTVRARTQEWQIPLGVYRITHAGDMTQRLREGITVEWAVGLKFSDRFKQIEDDDFLAVEAPVAGNSVWDEVRRLSPIPVQERLGNASVPPATIYDTRAGAIRTLIGLLGGAPHLTREGVLTARPRDAWLTETVPVFDIEGTIKWSDEMTDDFYNQVQVKSSTDAAIVAYSVIDDDSNPLSVNRAGGRTYRHSAPIYTTQASADAGAQTILARVSSRRSRIVTVLCTPEALLLELGDFGWMRDPVQERAALGEVCGITVSLDPTSPIQVQLIVAEEA